MEEWRQKCTKLVNIIDKLEKQLNQKDEEIKTLRRMLREKVYADAGTSLEEEEKTRKQVRWKP